MNLLSRTSPLLTLLLLIGCAHNPPAGPAAATPAQPAAAARAPLAPTGAGFSADMPGEPRESTAANGSHVYAAQVADVAYIISYADMPPEIQVTPQNTDALLDATRESIVHSGRAKVVEEKPFTVDGQPGRELQLVTKEGYRMRLRLAFLGARLYQVGVVTPAENATAPEIEKFLASFHFTARK